MTVIDPSSMEPSLRPVLLPRRRIPWFLPPISPFSPNGLSPSSTTTVDPLTRQAIEVDRIVPAAGDLPDRRPTAVARP